MTTPQSDEHGNINGFPLLGQSTSRFPNGRILLALEIARTPQELAAMAGSTIHIFLTPVQAMELARMLTDAGELGR